MPSCTRNVCSLHIAPSNRRTFNMKNNCLLKIGGIINFILSIGHIACLFCLDQVFKIYGISEFMNQLSVTYGASAPYLLTVFIAICFLACGFYALTGCGIIRKLPLLKLGIFTIASIFLFRTISGIVMMLTNFSWLELSSTSTAALVGILYFIGGIKLLRNNC